MKERPILFSAPMIRALLDDSKAQTRRVVGLDSLKPSETSGYDWTWRGQAPLRSIAQQRRHPQGCWQDATSARFLELCPNGVPGDRLWVKETHALTGGSTPQEVRDADAADGVVYRVDNVAALFTGRERDGRAVLAPTTFGDVVARWRPSIFMPRWASRITLEVTDVRCERLQSITLADAKAEGVQADPVGIGDVLRMRSARDNYGEVWDSINGDGAWALNPWVWAITFKKVQS
jgi:hypothetical protein